MLWILVYLLEHIIHDGSEEWLSYQNPLDPISYHYLDNFRDQANGE